MTTMPAFHEPRLPRQVQDAGWRLLSAALACRIAVDVADAAQARKWAEEVISLVDAMTPAVERTLTATPETQQPQQLLLPAI